MPDNFNEALVDCVKACGGSKQVGPLLWPEKTPDAAQRLLLDCLNDDRAAHLTPDHVLMILRLARSKSYHMGMTHIADALGYSHPTPIDPKDEVAELQRQFVAAAEAMQEMAAKLARLQSA